jgi:hypothetical protein
MSPPSPRGPEIRLALFPATEGALFFGTDLHGDIYRFFHHQMDKGNMTQWKQTQDYVAETPLDLSHLEQNTLGNVEVAREVLTLFERQASRVIREIGVSLRGRGSLRWRTA